MGSRVVPVRLEDDTLRLIDELVRLGIYSSRSEALRALIRIGARHAGNIRVVAESADKLFELEEREGDIPIQLRGALRRLIGERERF